MLNPILYTEKVLSDFLKYQLTTYPFADPNLHDQMRQLLSLEQTRNTPLFKGPYISLSRIFQEGAPVTQLIQEKLLHPHLQNLIPYPTLYGHQETAIRAIANHQPTLVSTGTGSGKTECFLYPIISHCLELRDRQAPQGITAVIVYPMNALAEDQLGRLRELLAGTGVSFGMYVGKTPQNAADANGKPLPKGSSSQDYKKAVSEAQRKKKSQTIYPPEERVSRQEMRENPPRILLTNIKQLELLLTRQQDVDLFNNVQLKFLVFDEAHTFTGASGAETACLIRRLKTFCQYQNPELNLNPICIATSATIADPTSGNSAGTEFAARFFGVDPQAVEIVTEQYQHDPWRSDRTIPPSLGEEANTHLKNILTILDRAEETSATGEQIRQTLQAIAGYQINPEQWQDSLYSYLTANEFVYQLAQTLTKPQKINELTIKLSQQLSRKVNEAEILFWLALGAASRSQQRPLLRPVIHGFVRGVGGAVVTFPSDRATAKLWLSSEEVEQSKEDTLYRLPITTCTTCGQHYYTHDVSEFKFHEKDKAPQKGRLVGTRQIWQPLGAERGGHKVTLVDRLINIDDDESTATSHPDSTALTYFCRHCGTLHSSPVQRDNELSKNQQKNRCDNCGALGDLVVLKVVRQKEKNPAKLTSCIACQSRGKKYLGDYREPNKPVRAIAVSDIHVLAQNLIHHAERRRLLIFADNRQDAAFQAGWMQDHARRFRLRSLMYQRIKEGGVSIGDLTAYLDNLLEKDDELSESIAPEVWQVARKEAEGTTHNNERKTFLRIHVLREVTAGLKQRLGLEPWGRFKVAYTDLQPNLEFFQTWSNLTGIAAEELCNGVSSLLDIARRNNILLDKEGQIFSKEWKEGDYEVQRGYMPVLQGVPRGLKLEREEKDSETRIQQWISQKGVTTAMECTKKWGIDKEIQVRFLAELWELLTEKLQLLHPVALKSKWNKTIAGCGEVYQIDGDRLKILPNEGLYRCQTCRRTNLHSTPNMACLAYRCKGTLVKETEDPDNYDLMVLDQAFSMLRPREHSAQVPTSEREYIENVFRNVANERINTLVCTPTLEMGVNIGALDAVLMRNVPPLPANYWQRAGRAGRQHRMAVNLTYCRPASHDRAYFQDPLKLLNGAIIPPRFNLRNPVMLEKHIHATILTALQQLATQSNLTQAQQKQIRDTFNQCLPTQIKSYLFNDEDHVRNELLNVDHLHLLITEHQAFIETYILKVFHQDPVLQELIEPTQIKATILETTNKLKDVIHRVWRRLQWAIAELNRLDELRRSKGTLDYEEEKRRDRCEQLIDQLKGKRSKKQIAAEGFDTTNTYSVLASEGFLPGYGLDTGSIKGYFQTPRTIRLKSFELSRPLGAALREYIPGNVIYANNNRFYPKWYQLGADIQPIPFQIDLTNEVIREITSGIGLHDAPLSAIPLCDVDLPHQDHISDDESYRFQLPVSVLGYEQNRHSGGKGYRWDNKNILFKRGNHLRLVNIGASKSVNQGKFGYPCCTVCGQTRSPFASDTEINNFTEDHSDRCGRKPERIAFYADTIADTLIFQNCTNREEAYSVAEAIRIGAAQILEMEIEDLQIIVFGQVGKEIVDVALYDPMPGGSGLLEQILDAWESVISAALQVVSDCPSQCQEACIDCLMTYRNAFYHRHLNRHTAQNVFNQLGTSLTYTHDFPAQFPQKQAEQKAQPVNNAEAVLKDLLIRAGFSEPIAQYEISLGKPLNKTIPDFFYDDPEEINEGICIYLDGLSQSIHGNSDRQKTDQAINDELESKGFSVHRIAASELTDYKKMSIYFSRIAQDLGDKKKAKELKQSQDWFKG